MTTDPPGDPRLFYWDKWGMAEAGPMSRSVPRSYFVTLAAYRALDADCKARYDKIAADALALHSLISRLPWYDAEGFYIDHGEHGKERVSVKDVMDSFIGAARDALNNAVAK